MWLSDTFVSEGEPPYPACRPGPPGPNVNHGTIEAVRFGLPRALPATRVRRIHNHRQSSKHERTSMQAKGHPTFRTA